MMKNEEWPLKYQQSGTGTDIKLAMDNGEQEKSQQDDAPDEFTTYTEDSSKVSEKAKQLIETILEKLKELSNTEKYLLYLKLFQKSNVVDPLRQPLNPLGSRSEINRTISWIRTHLEEDPETSLPKQQVYEEYSSYCSQNQIKSLSQADFGKVMKQVYPKVRPRRLGTRGNSRYCYSGLRRCLKLKPPRLPDLSDKPLSTETTCTESNLTAAAWLIVKEWSETHFRVPFPSLQALARFLVVNHSIGIGTEAANQLTTATDTQCKTEIATNKGGTKHREMQLQLQKKIQQKNDIKERKRKTIQSPKCESKKRQKSTRTTPTTTSSTPTSSIESSSSTGMSPTQGKAICDKSLDFTQLPDFKSFQKPVVCENNNIGAAGKVAIPRIKTQQQHRSMMGPTTCNNNNNKQQQTVNTSAKYKAIQPKPPPPQQCDNLSYNCPNQQQRQRHTQNAADTLVVTDVNRSQQDEGAPCELLIDRIKEKKSSDEEECDTTDDAETFPITRERLESISSVDKDAMDEYLGTNNSQHEEELSKYFNDGHPENSNTPNNPITTTNTTTTKLSQLRQLLEQNSLTIDPLAVPSYVPPAVTSIQISARRRVSFETPAAEDSALPVPPSPNTRRKNFSFTPISPGPQSPNSPFVSPRQTPVLRTKTTNHNAPSLKIKHEPNVDIPAERKRSCAMAASAPTSPMHPGNNQSMLEKLLHSNSKVTYTPDYTASILDNEFRSQSVPLNQMIKSNFVHHHQQTIEQYVAPSTAGDFNDFDPIAGDECETVNNIIEALDEQQNLFSALPTFDLMVNEQQQQQNFGVFTACSRTLGRSQSIDVNCELKCTTSTNPSRSVPSTPLSFNNNNNNNKIKIHQQQMPVQTSSRSYPSTPLMPTTAFNYSVNSDCLLNGQPIRMTNGNSCSGSDDDNVGKQGMGYFIGNLNDGTEDEFRHLAANEFAMDEHGVLIAEQNFNGNMQN